MATLWWFRSHVFHLEFPPEWKTPDIGKKTSRGGGGMQPPCALPLTKYVAGSFLKK